MKDREPIIYRQDASKPAVILISLLPFLLGVASIFSFFDRINRIGPDEWFLLLFGIALLFLTFCFLRLIFLPSFVLDDREMVIRKFFRAHKFRYDDIDAIDAYTLWVRPRDGKGRVLRGANLLETKQLLIKTRDGKTRKATLPSYGGNKNLLEELSRRSGKEIGELPEQTK